MGILTKLGYVKATELELIELKLKTEEDRYQALKEKHKLALEQIKDLERKLDDANNKLSKLSSIDTEYIDDLKKRYDDTREKLEDLRAKHLEKCNAYKDIIAKYNELKPKQDSFMPIITNLSVHKGAEGAWTKPEVLNKEPIVTKKRVRRRRSRKPKTKENK